MRFLMKGFLVKNFRKLKKAAGHLHPTLSLQLPNKIIMTSQKRIHIHPLPYENVRIERSGEKRIGEERRVGEERKGEERTREESDLSGKFR